MKPHFSLPPLLLGGSLAIFSLACSSSNPEPTSGAAVTRSEGRVLASSETGTDVYVLDLEQGLIETQSKSLSNASEMIISPEGNYALMSQSSGNRVDIF
jgi:Tol biopolymer transport system component